MINYDLYARIHHCVHVLNLTRTQTARHLGIHSHTVSKWIARDHYAPRRAPKRPSKLDPFKPQIVRWLETHPYSAVQLFQKLKALGYTGGVSILKEYVHTVRPAPAAAFLSLSFAPGECAQVDWGQFGSIHVGNTSRRLSFFVMVFCHSRLLYVEFTLAETMEHFLACHQNAFAYAGGGVQRVMVDNLKSAVLELTDFRFLNPAVREWLDTVANVRIHGTTKRRPVDLFVEEKPALRPLPHAPYDVGQIRPVRATNRFRVAFDANTYSVPAEYASCLLTLKAYPEELCIYREDRLIARHVRCYDRHQDFEHPDHPKPLLLQRCRAREQRLLQSFLSLSPKAEAFYRHLKERRFNVLHHLRQIVALSEIYGREKTARAIEDALEFQAFSAEYVANLLEQWGRFLPEPGALTLTRRQDLLDLELPEPDLGLYDPKDGPPNPLPGDDHAQDSPQAQ